MSTKIYQAFKFKGTQKELIPFLVKVRKEVKEDLLKVYLGTNLVCNYFVEKKEQTYLFAEFLIKQIRNNEWNFNIDSSVCVFIHNDNIYLQFFLPGDYGRYSQACVDMLDRWSDVLEDFHYQNSTDQPEEITEEEWENRREVWDEILEIDGRPGKSGLVWTILDEHDALMIAGDIYLKIHGK